MSTKHTPGPWSCVEYAKCFGIKADTGRQIAVMTEHHGDEPQIPIYQFDRSAQDAADAHLIAAAPELFEALNAAEDSIAQFGSADPNACILIALIAQAIAKATGGAE